MSKFNVGERVRVIAETHAWGRVKAGDVGVVKKIDGDKISVDFPAQKDWAGFSRCFQKIRKRSASAGPKLADETGFEVGEYNSSNRVAGLGIKTKEALEIERKTLKKFLDLVPGDEDRAETFMLGGKGKLVKEIILLPKNGGCRDTGNVSSENVANAVNTFVACGMTPLGFGITRFKIGRSYHDNTDSLLNNMKTWQILFPGCFVLVAAKRRNMAFQLGKKIKQLNLKIVKSKKKRR